ncbi:leukocyte elastase inhibitor [Oryzias latipes]|uniref:leukocyte elastase inhibitor n=1 Tax=Oryzias latipes TaxID=8090 RepID=UPI0000EA2163|nr:leukocyte elastase inhibitor [Oryzias latipes]XP_020556384.1 leukocyte elastase inhibitor [Oryzias latipes]
MASINPLSKANISFSLAMFRQLSEDHRTTNIFFSPFSISSALAMVMLGARGDTATQMAECLKTQDCQEEVHTLFQQLLEELNKPRAGFLLSVANRLYGEQSFLFLKEFLKQTSSCYNAELESVDFRNKYEEARIKINSWVEKQTQDKIKDLVGEGILNNTTTLVLVNAIYFKGTWDQQFLGIRTEDAEFRLNKKDKNPVMMMRQEAKFPYVKIPEIDCQILEMPYEGKELSMLIFLPREILDESTGLERLEKLLTYEKFMEWTSPEKMDLTKVDVRLPRFKMEEKYNLKKVLTRMGMVDAFDQAKCNFSGISAAKDLYLYDAIHKAFVEVNEKGTEAAAATAMFMCNSSGNLKQQYFTADHPFLFFIRHNSSMNILFAGRFCSPE